mmetsp:Transcript_51293/g.115323  ORF Transcript_51293/g.115323 Transcript_51293/m.115323 type:complete len:275 (-) Transcript_51293:839-1663(-)
MASSGREDMPPRGFMLRPMPMPAMRPVPPTGPMPPMGPTTPTDPIGVIGISGTACGIDPSCGDPGNGNPCGMMMRSVCSMRASSCTKHLRRSTTSLTVALLVPRSCSTSSMKSAKLTLSPLVKIKSEKSTKPTTSTPTSLSAFRASGCWRRAAKRGLEMRCLKPGSRSLITLAILVLMKLTTSVSFSTAATTLTTSTRTPINMFITVMEARRTNTSIKPPNKKLSEPSMFTTSGRSSPRQPCSKSVFIESGTELKKRAPTAVWRQSKVNPIAKT